ncbi:MAG: extracellular solute-binding protein family 5, partial [Dehalococcoidia bacterium]|nr:extracellular solute-binding protein family 5 [Dehalococcoidia bacterium]
MLRAKLALALVVVLFLAGIGYRVLTVEVPAAGGVYTEAIAGTPIAINPLLATFNDADKDLVSLVFSGLTRLGKAGEILPDLAEKWEVDPGGRIYTFSLRKDVRWHDGNPVTSGDVVFTLNLLRHRDFPGPPELASAWKGVSVEAPDPSTVRLTLKEPFAPFLTYTTLGVLPEHIFRGTEPGELAKSEYNASPVGTGPFQFDSGRLGLVTLKSNPAYHGGGPFISQ